MGYTKEQREANRLKKEAEAAKAQSVVNESVGVNTTVNDKTVGVVENINKVVETPKTKLQIKNIPLSTLVSVKKNCFGGLEYISKKTGFETQWDDLDNTDQPISLEELIIMRNSQRKFYEKNWIKILGFIDPEYEHEFSVEEILDFLQVKQFYKASLCPDNIDDVFELSPEQIKERVPNMSSGIKHSIVIRANELITNGKLDSLKVILALEDTLNCELIRPE